MKTITILMEGIVKTIISESTLLSSLHFIPANLASSFQTKRSRIFVLSSTLRGMQCCGILLQLEVRYYPLRLCLWSS